jgi:hypothetical protein
MNKKLLFGIMSLAALAACTNDDFESKNGAQVSEQVSPIQFEVINNAEVMRASMDGNSIAWSAADGDLFTLYHGAAYATPAAITGYQNATYTANANEGGTATLTTPSMILEGSAIMVWPADTTFRIKAGDNLTIQIPQVQGGKVDGKEIIQHQIPYVSDVIKIESYAAYNDDATKGAVTAYNTAGKDRKYQIYMRPMASQLNLKADYGNTESQIAALYEGAAGVDAGEGIDPIEVTSVDLLTLAGTDFTTEIPLQFAAPTVTPAQATNWASVANNAWTQVTNFNVGGIVAAGQTTQLTTKCLLDENKGCKFLILPQTAIGGGGVNEGAVVVNTTYGKVVVAPNTFVTNTGKYTPAEITDAWYRITNAAVPAATAATYSETAATAAETSGEFAGKYKTTADVMHGMAQVIDAFSANVTTKATSVVVNEPTGAAGTRYVKVLLNYLDMSALHIKTDKQLRDAAKVWKKMNLDDVTVYLDGNAAGEFEISQKTIKVINEINAAVAGKDFKVKPCQVGGEVCSKIVITGASEEANVQNLDFIRVNGTAKADVILKAGESWVWNGTVKVATAATTGINQFINKGTLTNNADKVLAITDNDTPTATQLFSIPLINDGTWNVTAGTLRVQFNVTNNGTVNISKGAQYLQDGQDVVASKTTFTNEATDKPSRFGGDDSKIGKVENKGVFATIGGADINNYGLIEHADKAAKTYITANQLGGAFNTAFGAGNKMGRINLPYSNKDEDNISVSAALAQGFVSVTVSTTDAPSDGILNASVVGNKVNYVIVNGGIESIAAVATQVKYVEFNQPNTEIEWAVAEAGYDGLMVLSPVNIKLGTKVAATVTYIGSEMYVGGTFNKDGAVTIGTTNYPATTWNGYYGNTTTAVATKYITF